VEQDCLARVESANRTCSALREELEDLRAELDDQIRTNDELRADLRKEKDLFHDYEVGQERHRREADRLAQANARLQEDNLDLENELRRLKEERRSTFDRLEALNRHCEDLQEARREKEQQVAALEREKKLAAKELK
jgi:hypothetical protein